MHAAQRVAFVPELVAEHLHELVDVVRRPGGDEDDYVEEDCDGGPAVWWVKARAPATAHLDRKRVKLYVVFDWK